MTPLRYQPPTPPQGSSLSPTPEATPRSALVELLRRDTRAAHDALHLQPLLHRLSASDLRIADYRRVLRAFASVYCWLEPELEAHLRQQNIDFDYSKRRKLHWLLDDIAVLTPEAGVASISPFGQRRFSLEKPGALIGALYVVEGSTLGGRQISRWVQRLEGISPTRGARFFNSYGIERSANWAALLGLLGRVAISPEYLEAARDSAVTLFDIFHGSLDAHEKSPA